MALTGSNDENKWGSKISLDCPFKMLLMSSFCCLVTVAMSAEGEYLFSYLNKTKLKRFPTPSFLSDNQVYVINPGDKRSIFLPMSSEHTQVQKIVIVSVTFLNLKSHAIMFTLKL